MNYSHRGGQETVNITTAPFGQFYGRWWPIRQFKLVSFHFEVLYNTGSGAIACLQVSNYGALNDDDQLPFATTIPEGTDLPTLRLNGWNLGTTQINIDTPPKNYLIQAELATKFVRVLFVNGGTPPPDPYPIKMWFFGKS